MGTVRSVACFLLIVAPLAGCSRPARLAYEEDLARTPAGASHGVHSERLLAVMRGLDRLTRERLPQDVDVESEREVRVEELVELARAIADSAEQIPQAAFQAALTEPERVAFHQRAALLRERALALARDARALSPAQRARATAELKETCDGCHAEFRAPREADGG
jgi:cytochrome c556